MFYVECVFSLIGFIVFRYIPGNIAKYLSAVVFVSSEWCRKRRNKGEVGPTMCAKHGSLKLITPPAGKHSRVGGPPQPS